MIGGRPDNAYIITLKFPDSQAVKSIPAGTYTFVIHDYSKIHNFALGSQTDNKRLFTGGIRSTGTKSYVLTLTPRVLRVRMFRPLSDDERHVHRHGAARFMKAAVRSTST